MRKTILLLAVLALFFSCDAWDTGGPSVSLPVWDYRIPEDFLGLQHAGNNGGNNQAQIDAEYAFLDAMGAKWLLNDISWDVVEPTDDSWTWSYDAWINRAYSRGYKVFGTLAYGNDALINAKYSTSFSGNREFPDATDSDGDGVKDTPPAAYYDYAQYVSETIKHYGSKVGGYQIWNEPNENPRFWRGDPEEIILLTYVASVEGRQALSAYNPGGALIGAPLNSLAVADWAEGFFSGGAMMNMDGVGFHPYLPGARRTAEVFHAFKDQVSKYGFENNIWLTEVGYPTGGQYVTGIAPARMPGEVVKTIVLLAAGGAKHVFWYQAFDNMPRGGSADENAEKWFGLAEWNAGTITKKPGADAFALCAKYLQGTTYRPGWPLRSKSGGNVQAYCFEGKETSTLVLWADTVTVTEQVPVTVTFPGAAERHQIETGTNTPGELPKDVAVSVAASSTVSVGAEPLFFTWTGSGAPQIAAP
jgi:hypothetical protein